MPFLHTKRNVVRRINLLVAAARLNREQCIKMQLVILEVAWDNYRLDDKTIGRRARAAHFRPPRWSFTEGKLGPILAVPIIDVFLLVFLVVIEATVNILRFAIEVGYDWGLVHILD